MTTECKFCEGEGQSADPWGFSTCDHCFGYGVEPDKETLRKAADVAHQRYVDRVNRLTELLMQEALVVFPRIEQLAREVFGDALVSCSLQPAEWGHDGEEPEPWVYADLDSSFHVTAYPSIRVWWDRRFAEGLTAVAHCGVRWVKP